MAKTPRDRSARKSTRPTRTRVSLKADDIDGDMADETSRADAQKSKNIARQGGQSSFQNRKAELYLAARKDGEEVCRLGIELLEEARSKMRDLLRQETPYEKHLQDIELLNKAQQASALSLMAIYPTLLEDIMPRRLAQMESASEMLKNHASRRQSALKQFSRNARVRVEKIRENEKTATDASALIKHYKNLLLE